MRRGFEFEQVYNFRDIGGYAAADGHTVRWRRLFRSGEPQRMSESEAEHFSTVVGLATMIDLRSDDEANHRAGIGPLLSDPVVRHHFPMGDPRSKFAARSTGTWDPHYDRLLTEHGADWAAIVRLLADPGTYPALFHCVTGKDRTGVLASLVLGALGVDEQAILDDFALSKEGMDRLVSDLRERGKIGPDEAPNPALAVPVPALEEMLSALRREFGGAANFLSAHGTTDRVLESLAEELLE